MEPQPYAAASAARVCGGFRLLQGMQDIDVQWQWSAKIVQALIAANVRVTLVKDSDSHLSRESDTLLLTHTLYGLDHDAPWTTGLVLLPSDSFSVTS
jgi:hypothetical protein